MKKKSLSEATKRKISRAQKGTGNSMYGRHHTSEALKKIRLASKGKNNPMYGKTHTAASLLKISMARKKRSSKRRLK